MTLALAFAFVLQQEPFVFDGPAEDLDSQPAAEPLRAHWGGFGKGADPVKEYFWAIDKKLKGGKVETVQPYTSVKLETKGEAKIELEPGKQYYVSVKAVLKSGAEQEARANGIRIEKEAGAPPAAGDSPKGQLAKFALDTAGLSVRRSPEELGDSVIAALENPATRNVLLKGILSEASDWKILKDLHLEFKVLDVNQGAAVLGVSYDFEKAIHQEDLGASGAYGFEFRVKANGTAAFDRDRNPEDFLVSSLSLDVFGSHGGTAGKVTPEQSRALERMGREMADIKDKEALLRSDLWRDFNRFVQDHLSTQVYGELGIAASLESNQSFSEKQYAFEATAGLDVKAWNTASLEAHLNLLDYPAALLRVLSGYDERLTIRGSTWPTVIAAVGWVNPHDDDPRALVGDRSGYWRLRAEASFRTPVARIAGSAVHVNANLRYYHEVHADRAVRTAGVDRYAYYSIDVASEKGVYVGYSAGKLPFDAEKDQVYEAGLRVSF